MYRFLVAATLALNISMATTYAQSSYNLFDGRSLENWDFAEGGWVVDQDGSMSCRMETVTQKNGTKRVKGKGYIWTKSKFRNFELRLSYKLSDSANSGVFFRTDKRNPVQSGFEVQLLDNVGFQKVKGKKDPKNLNGALYDCQAAKTDPQLSIGQWNTLKLVCRGPIIKITINDVLVNEVNIDLWDTPNKNPDGSTNKFGKALKSLPRSGHIGFQNHGQVVWFKDVTIQEL